MNPGNARSGPPTGRPGTTSTPSIVVDIQRRRWKLHQRFTTARKVSAALDARCGIERPEVVEIDYAATGLALGWPERRAAGLALLAAEQAA